MSRAIKWYNSGMKNYSSARAGKGKTAYRTPSTFRYLKVRAVNKIKTSKNFNIGNFKKI